MYSLWRRLSQKLEKTEGEQDKDAKVINYTTPAAIFPALETWCSVRGAYSHVYRVALHHLSRPFASHRPCGCCRRVLQRWGGILLRGKSPPTAADAMGDAGRIRESLPKRRRSFPLPEKGKQGKV